MSVIVPCHDAEPYLAQAIGSVLDQSAPPTEVIVVDDGSTDDSMAVALRFAQRWPEIVRVVSQDSRSASATRNIGAAMASGDALMFLDADDVVAPDTLAALTSALGRQPGGVAVCPWHRLNPAGGMWRVGPASPGPRRSGHDALQAWMTGWYHPPCSVLWSREGFERAGRWDETCRQNDDGDLMMRALVHGVPLVETQRGAGFYRRMPQGRSSLSGERFTRAGLEDRIRVMEKVVALLEHQGRLHPYRAAIGESFSRIAADACETHADLAAAASQRARRYDVARPSLERAAREVRHVHARALSRVRRRTSSPAPVNRPAPHDRREVPYGLEVAATAELATPHQHVMGVGPPPDMPTVSVIIPTYNRARLLQRALDSVLAQTFGDYEVVIVDDGGVDETDALVTSYRDPRLRYVRQSVNSGVSAARNRGMREAQGRFIAFLDSDDEWHPAKLALQVQRFNELSVRVGLLYTGVVDDDGEGRRQVKVPRHRGNVYQDMLEINVLHGGGSNVMIRRCVVATVGFFDEQIPAIEDYEYWLRITRFFEVDFLEEPLVRYHDVVSDERRSREEQRNLRARAWFYRKHGAEMRRHGVAHHFLLRTARRHLKYVAGRRRSALFLALRALVHARSSRDTYRFLARAVQPKAVRSLRRRATRTPTREGGRAEMRLMLFTSTSRSDTGGVQSVFGELAVGLRARGHVVTLAWGRPSPDGADEGPVFPLHVPVGDARSAWSRTRSVLRAVRSLVVLWLGLRRVRPQIVNVHFARPEVLHLLLLRPLFRYKLVVSAHGSDVLRPLEHDAPWLARLLPRADVVTAVSSQVAAAVSALAGVPVGEPVVIPNGVDGEFWCPDPDDEVSVARRRPIILTVGRLTPVKGYDVLLHALPRVLEEVPDARLIMVGDGGQRDELGALAEALGLGNVVSFLGSRGPEQVRDQMRRARAFALPSKSEGMPLALLEAMAVGLPPVATRVGGVPDVVTEGSGLLVPPDDSIELAGALIKVLSDGERAAQFSRSARARAASFALSSVHRRYEELFGNLLSDQV